MILRFYLFCVVYVSAVGGLALLKKKAELLKRAVTLIIALHVLCLVLLGGEPVFSVFTAVLLAAGVYEITGHTRGKKALWMLVSLGLGVTLFFNRSWLNCSIPLFLLTSIFTLAGKEEDVWSKYHSCGFILLVLVPCAVSLRALYGIGPEWVMALILLLQLNDGFGYLFGKSLGRRRVFKRLSPNKSLEGYAFGLMGIALGTVLLHSLIPVLKGYPLSKTLLLAVYMFLFGNTGDLLFSAVKRRLKIKDFSNMLPGHGGVLDRFDNILFAAPVLYFMLQGW